MSRAEFSKPVKREALKRARGQCEARGEWYGLGPAERCENDFSRGVHFDHIILEANSHDNSLENCAAVCISCHDWKTRKRDIPLAAKTLRQQDKHKGIRKKSTMPCSRASAWKKKMNGEVIPR